MTSDKGLQVSKLSFFRGKGVRTPTAGERWEWGGGRHNRGAAPGVVPGSPRCAGSGCSGCGRCSPRGRRQCIRRGRGRPAPRRSLPGSGSTAGGHVLRTPPLARTPAPPQGCADSSAPAEGARPRPARPLQPRPSPSRAPPPSPAPTSSSPFSAASCSGVPPHRSAEISPPCSRSQLSTLAWPRLAAKCMAVAPSLSCSDRLTSVQLTWAGGGAGKGGAGRQAPPGPAPSSRPLREHAPPLPGPRAHQPHDDRAVAHLRRGVQRGHAVVGARVRVRAALLHQVLRHLQVALLARQVQGRGTVLGLGIHSPAETQHPPWALSTHLPPKPSYAPSSSFGEFRRAGRVGWRRSSRRVPLSLILSGLSPMITSLWVRGGGDLAWPPPPAASLLQCTPDRQSLSSVNGPHFHQGLRGCGDLASYLSGPDPPSL